MVSASLGTSGTIYAYSAKPVVDPRGEIAAFCSSTGGWLPLLCTMNVTLVTEQFRSLFGWDHAALDQAVAATPPGAGGLALLPYLVGERTPSLPGATGVLAGLTRQTLSPGGLARAAMEGATLGMNYGLNRLAELGMNACEIRLTGGGARSPVWRQLMADIFGVPVVAMGQDESAALGTALQAAWCAALRDNPRARLTDFTTNAAPSPALLPGASSGDSTRGLHSPAQARLAGRRPNLTRETSQQAAGNVSAFTGLVGKPFNHGFLGWHGWRPSQIFSDR